MDVMCVMHDQDEYGVIRWPLKQIALAVHTSVSSLRKLVDKEILKGADPGQTCEPFIYVPKSGRKEGAPVTLIPAQPGPIWYSSRMVRDEYLRQVRGDNEPKAPPTDGQTPSPKMGIGEGFGDSFGAGKKSPPSHASAHDTHPSSSVSDSDPSSVSSNGSPALPRNFRVVTGNKNTSPKNGDGEAPQKTPEQIATFAIWTIGVQALVSSGVTEKNARSFLGKQQKTYGNIAVADAVVAALAENATAPLEYIVSVLQRRGLEKQNGNRNGTSQTRTNQTAAERRNAATVRASERARELRSLGDGPVESILRRESRQAG